MRHEDKYTKLAHYMSRDMKKFVQYDGFKAQSDWDHVCQPDEKGRSVMIVETEELMQGSDVRVLVPPDAHSGTVVELLLMIAETIQTNGVFKMPVYRTETEQERLEAMNPFV